MIDVVEIRKGSKLGHFSALLSDSNESENKLFLARTYFNREENEKGIDYSFVLDDAKLPGLRMFRAQGRTITSREIADEASHYLLRSWAESQDCLIDDKTIYTGIEYTSPPREIDFLR